FAIVKRPSDGLLANLYEFPNCRGWLGKEAAEDYLAKKGYLVLEIRPLPESKHVFSHLTWRMHAYAVKIAYLPSNGQFVARKEDTLRPTDVQFSARQEDSLMPTDVQFATKQEDFSLQTDVQFAAKQKASSLLTDGLLAAGQEDDDAGNGDWIFAGPKEIQSHYPVPSAFAKYMECMAELSGA
ncbi:MAG: NUDIX domain-containing protein, partial [Lachnospiraceae bacterium]